jgi:hypothetical protein
MLRYPAATCVRNVGRSSGIGPFDPSINADHAFCTAQGTLARTKIWPVPNGCRKKRRKRRVLGFNRHETGHFLSGEHPPKHDNGSKDNLMYEDQTHGAFLPNDRILRWFPNLDE